MSRDHTSHLFRKQFACPSSQTLLAYIKDSLPAPPRLGIRSHLADCDFCGAELQLLSKHPPTNGHYVLARVPLFVFLLAEKLLPGRPAKKDQDGAPYVSPLRM